MVHGLPSCTVAGALRTIHVFAGLAPALVHIPQPLQLNMHSNDTVRMSLSYTTYHPPVVPLQLRDIGGVSQRDGLPTITSRTGSRRLPLSNDSGPQTQHVLRTRGQRAGYSMLCRRHVYDN
jgi:hypothetical protein